MESNRQAVDEAVTREAELRRWLRQASVLLATSDAPERYLLLRRARHILAATLVGLDQLLEHEARVMGVPDTIDDPLTGRLDTATIEEPR